MIKMLVAMVFLGLNFYIYEFMASDEIIPTRKDFAAFPTTIGDWQCAGTREMDAAALKFLGATDYVICNYVKQSPVKQSPVKQSPVKQSPVKQSPVKQNTVRQGAVSGRPSAVDLYVGYHASQVRKEGGGGNANSIHPPEHCLPGSGWDIIDSELVPIAFPGLPEGHGLRETEQHAKRFIIANGEARELVYFWYQSQGRVITANEDVILFRFWNRATRGRTDGSLVRFTTTIERGDIESAQARFHEFAKLITPILPSYLPD